MTLLAVRLAALLLAVGSPLQPARIVKAWVYADLQSDKGFVSPAAQSTLDAVKDLQHELMGHKGTLSIITAPSRDTADVGVQVLGREESPDDSDKRVVHVKVIVKDYSLSIDGKNDDGSWRDAAKDAAKQIVTWINLNFDKIAGR